MPWKKNKKEMTLRNRIHVWNTGNLCDTNMSPPRIYLEKEILQINITYCSTKSNLAYETLTEQKLINI